MRKPLILSLTILGLMAGNAFGQKVNLATGPENKKADSKSLISATIIDETPSSLLMITRDHGGFMHGASNEDVMFKLTDKGLNGLKEAKIVNSKECEVLGFGTTDTTATVLLCDKSRKTTELSRAMIDRRSFKIVAADVVKDFRHERRDKEHIWHATSQDGQHTAVVVLTVTNNDTYSCEVVMLDQQMNMEWDCKQPINGISDMYLTNQGELYVMAKHRVEMSTTLQINKFNAGSVETAEVVVPDGLHSCVIANVTNNRLLMGGSLIYPEARHNETRCNAIFVLSYDMVARQIVKFSTAELHHNDLAVLTDKKQSARIRKYDVPDLIPDQTCTTEFGGAFTFTRPMAMVKTASNGMETTYHNHIGMVVVGADMNGNLLYKVPIRHYQMQTGGYDMMKAPLISDGTNVFFFHTEHPKTTAEYNIAKRTKCVQVMHDKVNTAMYAISPAGTVSKVVTSTKQKNLILGSSHAWYNGKYMLLHVGGKESHVLQMKNESAQ